MRQARRVSPVKIAIYAVLILWALTTVYPFVWVLLNSFREKGLIRRDSFSSPLPGNGFTLDNYKTAMERFDFGNAYLNSLLISLAVTLTVVVIAGLAAYGMTRYRFRIRGVLYSLITAGMMFPVFSTIIPVFRMEVAMGVASSGNRWLSLLAVILPQIAGNLCFSMMVLMGFIRSVPIALEESAYIDGCNVFQVYFHIIMPAAKSSFATVAIFSFLWSYNDLFTQNFFLRFPREKTITLLLNEISQLRVDGCLSGADRGAGAAGLCVFAKAHHSRAHGRGDQGLMRLACAGAPFVIC